MTLSLGNAAIRARLPQNNGGAGSELHEVTVNHEALIFKGARIHLETFAPQRRHYAHWQRPSRYAWFLVRNYAVRRQPRKLDSALWVIDNTTPQNYYHWLTDCLVRLLKAESVYPEYDRVLLPRYYQHDPFVEFTMRAFPRLRIEWVEIDRNVRVDRLMAVAHTPRYYMELHPTYDAELIRGVASRVGEVAVQVAASFADATAPRASERGGATRRRIYWSRERVHRRRAANEAEVQRVLHEHDVETVHIDSAKPWEQIVLSQQAELIVGVHGAALANLIFMPPGGRVVELHRRWTPGEEHPFYAGYMTLSRTLGLGYAGLQCELAKPVVGPETNHADVVVDLDALREQLR